MSSREVRNLSIPEGLNQERVDAALSRLLGLSRNVIVGLIESGEISKLGKPIGKSDRVITGDQIEVLMPAAKGEAKLVATPIDGLKVVYDDGDTSEWEDFDLCKISTIRLFYNRKNEFASATNNVKITDTINKGIIKGHYAELFQQIGKQGFVKVRVNGEIKDIVSGMKVDRYKTHDIEIVIDRIAIESNEETEKRLAESINTAMYHGENVLINHGVIPAVRQGSTVP